jgi:hypothetical protein
MIVTVPLENWPEPSPLLMIVSMEVVLE